jgi:small ligand-binding sensory domain FIST
LLSLPTSTALLRASGAVFLIALFHNSSFISFLAIILQELFMPGQTKSSAPQFASAINNTSESAQAIETCLGSITKDLQGQADLVVVFATPHHRDQFEHLHKRIADTLAPSATIGMTAGGVIGVKHETENKPGISILAARLPGATLHAFRTQQINLHQDDVQAVQKVVTGQDAATSPSSDVTLPHAIALLADPFSCPMTNLLPKLTADLNGTPLIGGIASGARNPGGNRLLINGDILTEGGVGLSIGGDVRVDTTISQGCKPIGKTFIITKSQHNIIKEIGGNNVLEVMQDMLANIPEEDRDLLQTNGWLVGRVVNEYKDRFGRGDFLIRQVIGMDPNAGYIAIGDANLRVGQTVQFHVRDQRTAREDFALLLEAQKLHGSQGGALLFSCNGRGTHLFDTPHADANIINNALQDIPLAGCFAAGEIGPVGKENHLHGHTASLAVIRANDS